MSRIIGVGAISILAALTAHRFVPALWKKPPAPRPQSERRLSEAERNEIYREAREGKSRSLITDARAVLGRKRGERFLSKVQGELDDWQKHGIAPNGTRISSHIPALEKMKQSGSREDQEQVRYDLAEWKVTRAYTSQVRGIGSLGEALIRLRKSKAEATAIFFRYYSEIEESDVSAWAKAEQEADVFYPQK